MHPESDNWIAGEPTPDEIAAAYDDGDDDGPPSYAPTEREHDDATAADGILIPGVRIAMRRLRETLDGVRSVVATARAVRAGRGSDYVARAFGGRT